MNKNDFDQQGSSYQEESFSRGQTRARRSVRDEINQLQDAGDNIEETGNKKVLIIVIAVVVLVVLLLGITLIISLSKKSSGTTTAQPEFYNDPVASDIPSRPYTSDIIQQLRQAGYTADEIEQYELNGDEPSYLLEMAEEERLAQMKVDYKYLMDNIELADISSFVKNTTYVNPATPIPKLDKDEWGEFIEPIGEVITENVDYWKVPLHGHQAFLKIKLKSGELCFFQITMARYNTLRDSGNIVVDYTKIKVGKQTFIESIAENLVETEGLN